jgi:hypothetical protein
MGITDLRAHRGRILTVFGAPIGFAITGFLHLVADGDAPDIYTGLKGHAGLWIAIRVVQLLLILLQVVENPLDAPSRQVIKPSTETLSE